MVHRLIQEEAEDETLQTDSHRQAWIMPLPLPVRRGEVAEEAEVDTDQTGIDTSRLQSTLNNMRRICPLNCHFSTPTYDRSNAYSRQKHIKKPRRLETEGYDLLL
jgi:hypothetical protein